MTHEQCRDSLGAWLDGELTPQAAASVAEHVGACATCRAAGDEIRAVGSILRALPRQEIPPDLRARLLRSGGAVPARPAWRRPWALASLASAAAAAIIVIGIIGLRRADVPLLARFDAKAEVGLERNTEPRGLPQEIESQQPQGPAGRSDRFVPLPPDPPVDSKSFGYAAAPAPTGVGAERGDESMKREIISELPTIVSEESSARKTSSSNPASPPAALETLGSMASSALTYDTRLTVDEDGAWRLEPVAPRDESVLKDTGKSGTKASADVPTSSEPAAGAPAMARTQDAATAAPLVAAEGEQQKERDDLATAAGTQMLFLVQLDAGGTITSAQLVGARTTSPEIVEAARSLLVGTRFPGTAVGRWSHATVRVLVPPPLR